MRLQPIGLDAGRGKLVLEGTIDTLPTHHQLVTRWLKVYVLCNLPGRKIAHVTFTIRGQILSEFIYRPTRNAPAAGRW